MPVNQQPNSVELSGRLLDQVEQYAKQHGITPDEAFSRLVSQGLRARYVRNRPSAPVIALKRIR